MRIARVFVWIAVFTAAASMANAGEISPALALEMTENIDRESLTVLVIMRDRVDIEALDLSLHYQRAPLAIRHRTVIESLRDKATTTQVDLLAELATAKNRGDVLEYRAYWIINGVRLTASEATIRAIAARDDVEIVEADLRVELIAPVRRGAAGETRSIGITPGLVNIGARRVWDELGIRGEGTLIASLDTGVDGNHPALADRWRGNHAPWQECWLDVAPEPASFPFDVHGHGTHCTGTMTGLAPDDTIGVAPAAEWIAANPIDNDAPVDFDSSIIDCFEWFTDPDGDPSTMDDVPDVIQNSWGVYNWLGYPPCYSAWWDVIDACEAAGPVVIFAAGNEGSGASSLRSPADRATSLTNCFAVGATLHSPPYTIAGFSSRGPSPLECGPLENLTKPEMAAPGVDVYSSVPGGVYEGGWDGTSMATPHVCGVVALMRSANPDADVITIKEILMGTSHDLGVPGEDNDYGHGFLDAYASVTQVMGGFGNIEGTVTDAVTGDPVAGAHVRVLGGYGQMTTDASGYYTFRIPAGPQVVEVTAYSYEILNEPVMVTAGETLVADLQLVKLPLVTVSGTVYQPGGNPSDGGTPAAGAGVAVVDAAEPMVMADGEGRYSISLPYGRDFTLSVTSGIEGYLTQTVPFYQDLSLDFYLNAGNTEGFESGDLTTFGWFAAGDAPWSVQSDEVHSGVWAAQSGTVGDDAYSQMHAFVNCGDGGEVAFWFKVSSEAGDDFLRVYVGNVLMGEWSGEVDWSSTAFPVGPGTNHIRFRYAKGAAGSGGADAAWIDDILFPGGLIDDPKLVPAPQVVEVELDGPFEIATPGYLFNMGEGDLNWNLSESIDWLEVMPAFGALPKGMYQELTFSFDAVGLPDGVHSAFVTVNSNDPLNPMMGIEARLELITDTTAAPNEAPRPFALLGAVPNPFNPTTQIRFALPSSQHATLAVYDLKGRLVRTLADEQRPAGLNEIRWEGRDAQDRAVASGTYFARLQAGGRTSVKSLTMVR